MFNLAAERVAGPHGFMAPETSEHLVVLRMVMMAGGYRDAEHSLMRTRTNGERQLLRDLQCR